MWYRRRSMATVLLVASALVLLVGLASEPARAQSYPTKEITMIVPYTPGGSTDLVARFLAEPLEKELGRPVVVVNKPGGGGAVGWQLLAAARPDGYTFGYTTKALMIQKYTMAVGLDYKRLTNVAKLVSSLGVIAVGNDAPWRSLEAFLAAARANPGKLRVGNSGAGATWHLFAAAIEDAAKVKFTHVPYDGGNPAVVALAGGHIEAVTMDLGTILPLLPTHRIRMLAVNADERLSRFADVPTLREQHLSLQWDHWTGLAAPAGTPREAVDKVAAALKKVTGTERWREFVDRYAFLPTFLGPEQLGAVLDREDTQIATVVQRIGLRR